MACADDFRDRVYRDLVVMRNSNPLKLTRALLAGLSAVARSSTGIFFTSALYPLRLHFVVSLLCICPAFWSFDPNVHSSAESGTDQFQELSRTKRVQLLTVASHGHHRSINVSAVTS